ncbi:hypothetical protein A9L43_16065 [Pseudomonas mosselii]|uniref:hypothetical protein n=1 Tax=Pseudomonas TaxID=286 RepID=UPI00083D2133|nr:MULTISPECIES: hypothetical protein [Pseudomonas]ODB39614.1 hypothetical protein A9L43_16065 [Pseudomonas mosselii]
MATNNFLPFGGAAGANVLTQADYAALAARTTGFVSGTANSAQLNKVWRQSSIISAAVAQFIADISGQDAIDDGSTATLVANLKSAVSAQSISVVGTARNLKMVVPSASNTATLTADEIIVESTLGGLCYRLPSFSQTINLATTGAGGMDTGTAPISGFVALYAICNITTSTRALLAVNASSSVAPEVYAGANMPGGYIASALVGVWPTDASGRFIIGAQNGRVVNRTPASIINTSSIQASFASLGIGNVVPRNAKRIKLLMSALNNTTNTVQTINLATDANGSGQQSLTSGVVLIGNGNQCTGVVEIATPITIYYQLLNNGGGTPTFNASVSGYEF